VGILNTEKAIQVMELMRRQMREQEKRPSESTMGSENPR
jgi:hypothetical protein